MRAGVLLTVLLTTVWLTLSSSSPAAAGIPDQARLELQKLEESSGGAVEVQWDKTTGTPSLLAGHLSKPSKHSPQWIAGEFVKSTKKLYGLNNPAINLKIIDVEHSSDSLTRVRFQHLLFGRPVWGDGLTIAMDKQGVIKRVEGRITPNLEKRHNNRPMHAALSKKKAIETAAAAVKVKGSYMEVSDAQLYYLPARPGTPLVYVITLKGSEPENGTRHIFIHGLTGRVIEQIKENGSGRTS
ncbi:MAG: hypothetical protein K0S39_5236 [Paenibacillus sp.]|jgi:Zn-dependent metalloprotease|nr:hypothetical protein [Paenibacillus sp.]